MDMNDPAYDPDEGMWKPYRDGHPGWAQERAGEIQYWLARALDDAQDLPDPGAAVVTLPPQPTFYTAPGLPKVGNPVPCDEHAWALIGKLLGEFKAVVNRAHGRQGDDDRPGIGTFLPDGDFDHRAGAVGYLCTPTGTPDAAQPLCRHCAHCLHAATTGYHFAGSEDPEAQDPAPLTCVGCGEPIRRTYNFLVGRPASPVEVGATDDILADRKFADDDDLDDVPF